MLPVVGGRQGYVPCGWGQAMVRSLWLGVGNGMFHVVGGEQWYAPCGWGKQGCVPYGWGKQGYASCGWG